METRLDEHGNLPLPAELRSALGWKPGQALHLQVSGEHLLVQPAAPGANLKEEARKLADAMRGLALGATRHLSETVSTLGEAARSARPATPERADSTTGIAASDGVPATAGATLLPFQGVRPRWGQRVFLAPGSTLTGDIVLGDEVSIWPGVSMRGDVAAIRIGSRTNIQDGAIVHVSPHLPCTLGAGVTVGHQATVHACQIADDTLIGIQAVVLDGAQIGRHCIIAAGAVVPPGAVIPDGKMVMGIPGKVIRDLQPQEIERIHWNADAYVTLKEQYLFPTADQTRTPVAAAAPPKPAPPRPGELPRHECRRAAGPIRVDGALDDPGWAGVLSLSPLVHSNGTGMPTQETEVKLCWDDQHLYLSYACKDADIWANYEDRDDPLYDEEVVEFFLCPTGNLQHYYEFEISPANVLFDAKVFCPEGDRATMLVDKEWNSPGIRTAVRVAGLINDRRSPDIGWIAEAAVPFTDLGLPGPPAPGTVWRANFYRIERGERTEFTAWSPTLKEPADFHVPACFGEIVFVE